MEKFPKKLRSNPNSINKVPITSHQLYVCKIDLIGSQESCESVAREGGTISGYYNLNLYSSVVIRK